MMVRCFEERHPKPVGRYSHLGRVLVPMKYVVNHFWGLKAKAPGVLGIGISGPVGFQPGIEPVVDVLNAVFHV